MTYGDGVSDIDISASIAFHKQHGGRVTIAAVQPAARFGALGMMEPSSLRFRRSHRVKADGSMVVSLCCHRKCWMKSTRMRGCLNGNQWTASPHNARCMHFCTTDSGTQWIPCATSNGSKSCGPTGGHRGRHGENLAGASRFPNRSHWFQGQLACAVAE